MFEWISYLNNLKSTWLIKMTIHRLKLCIFFMHNVGSQINRFLLPDFALHFVKLFWVAFCKSILLLAIFTRHFAISFRMLSDLWDLIWDSVELFRDGPNTQLLRTCHMSDISLILNKSWLLQKWVLFHLVVVFAPYERSLMESLYPRVPIEIRLPQWFVIYWRILIFHWFLV